jgi:C4-type Zn-finger protein
MKRATAPELSEFRGLMAKIREEIASMKKAVLSDEEEKEENEILSKFNSVIETQVFSTIFNIALYQLRGWRELIDE